MDNLYSKKKHYGCVKKNIFKRLNDKSDLELFDEGQKLNGMHSTARLMKVRVQSCGRGKSDGFRMIVFVHKNDKKYYLLDIYPKNGPYHKANMKAEERKECLLELKNERSNSSLFNLKLDTDCKEIVVSKPKKVKKKATNKK